MARIGGDNSKNVTWYAIGGLAAMMVVVSIALWISGGPTSTPTAAPAAAPAAGSLGTAEGNAAYYQSFQEKVITTLNSSVEQTRAENRATMQAFRQELEAKQAQQLQQFDELLKQAAQVREQQEVRPTVQVEKISVGSTLERKVSGTDGGFLGSPADVKPAGFELTTSTEAGDAKKSSKSEPVIPPNGFVDGRTLNGVVAVVGAPPVPFQIKLVGKYRAANGFVINLDGCIAYAEGRADLPSKRVKGKPAKLTCNFQDGSSQTWDVAGYITDKDGIEGILGEVNDNSDKKLTGATIAGGISVAGNALSRAQTSTFTGGGGAVSAFTGSIGQDLAGGLLQGGGAELSKQFQEYYNSYASSVQVGGNRDVTLVLLNELTVPEPGRSITANRTTPKSGVFQ